MEGLLDQRVTNEMHFREMDLEANKWNTVLGSPVALFPITGS